MRNGKYIEDGEERWYQNSERHRDNGPAVTKKDGSEVWYKNGKLHREDGPAAAYADGSEYWYQNGERHRMDGPAVIYKDGSEFWFRNGSPLTESEILLLKEKNGFDKMMKDMLSSDGDSA